MKYKYIKTLIYIMLICSLFTGGDSIMAENNKFELYEKEVSMFKRSYKSLKDRVEKTGYAPTSVTGAYPGMFIRDSSIQIMAHTAYGDTDISRSMLNYLLGYHVALGAERTAHIVPNFENSEYNNSYVVKSEGSGIDNPSFCSQLDYSTALYKINGPNNAAAQEFVPYAGTIKSVRAYLTKSRNTDKVNVSIRTAIDDENSSIAEMVYIFGENPNGWHEFVFDKEVNVIPGNTYYLVLQADRTSGNVIWNGINTGINESRASWNYDKQAIGGWKRQTETITAFEINQMVSINKNKVVQEIILNGNELDEIQVNINAEETGGIIEAELTEDFLKTEGTIAKATCEIDKKGSKTYSLVFENKLMLESEKTYYLTLTTKGTSNEVSWLYASEYTNKSYVLKNGLYEDGYTLDSKTLPELSGENKAEIIKLGGNNKAVQQIPAKGETVTAVNVILGKNTNASGKVKASLYKEYGEKGKLIGTYFVDSEELSESGEWVTLYFNLPLFDVNPVADYYLELTAEASEEGSIIWYGTTKNDEYSTRIYKNNKVEAIEGEASFTALKSKIGFITNHEQPDGNYMLIHAWTQYVNKAENTEADRTFIEESYPIIARFSNYYIDNGYIDDNLNLMRNPNLEHSREGRYWNAYDLITNVFASQSLKEMSEIANLLGDADNGRKWENTSKQLERGIHENLTTEMNGKTIYAELLNADQNNEMIKGFSWVNQAFIAAEWYAVNDEIAANTIEAYKTNALIDYEGHEMLDACYDLKTGGSGGHVIGKGFSWDLMYSALTNNTERLEYLIGFSTKFSSETGIYPESWWSGGTFSDIGNQEHCSWQVYAMEYAFPELKMKSEPENSYINSLRNKEKPKVNFVPYVIVGVIAAFAAVGTAVLYRLRKKKHSR